MSKNYKIQNENDNKINIYKCSKQDKLCCKYGHRINYVVNMVTE